MNKRKTRKTEASNLYFPRLFYHSQVRILFHLFYPVLNRLIEVLDLSAIRLTHIL